MILKRLACVGIFGLICPLMGMDSTGAMFRANPGRTGEFQTTPLTALTGELWRNSEAGSSFSSPAVTATTLYISSYYGLLTALNSSTGSPIWQADFGPTANISSPAVDETLNRLVVGTGGPEVRAYNATTGADLWQFATVGNVEASPVIDNNVVYIADTSGRVYALNSATGIPIWTVQPGGSIYSSCSVEAGLVVIATLEGDIVTLDATNGNELMRQFLHPGLTFTCALRGGVIYTGNGIDRVLAIGANTGLPIWTANHPVRPHTTVAATAELVYLVDALHQLQALDASDGLVAWSAPLNGVAGAPVTAGNAIYVGTGGDTVFAFDRLIGTPLWTFDADDQILADLAVRDGVVYVATFGGEAIALN